MKPIRQGDVILMPIEDTSIESVELLPHVILAEGEVTGHRHQITEGKAVLYYKNSNLYLKVLSEHATLTHEEHEPVQISEGTWLVKIQREYEPNFIQNQDWRYVAD